MTDEIEARIKAYIVSSILPELGHFSRNLSDSQQLGIIALALSRLTADALKSAQNNEDYEMQIASGKRRTTGKPAQWPTP
jgi:hypothetical protein